MKAIVFAIVTTLIILAIVTGLVYSAVEHCEIDLQDADVRDLQRRVACLEDGHGWEVKRYEPNVSTSHGIGLWHFKCAVCREDRPAGRGCSDSDKALIESWCGLEFTR